MLTGSTDTASATKRCFTGDVDVRDVLVLAEKRQMQNNGEWGSVCGEDNDLAHTTVQSLGGLVGSPRR